MVKVVETELNFSSPVIIYDLEIMNDISVPGSSYWDYEKGDVCVAGFIIGDRIIQVVHEHNGDTEEFKKILRETLKNKDNIHAFNFVFEQGVTYGLIKRKIFIHEIKSFKGKGFNKDRFFQELVDDKKVKEIPNDPFNGDGGLCLPRWKEGKIDEILEHNRSCLIKEYHLFIHKNYLLEKFKDKVKDGWYKE